MQKLIFVLVLLTLSLGCVVVVAEQTYQSANFEYARLPNGDAELIRYLGEEGTVIIPNSLDGHPITAVRGNPFTTLNGSGYVNGVKNCTINVAIDHPYIATINGVLFGKTDRKLIYCSKSKEGEYAIPQGIRIIGEYAFYSCVELSCVTIPDSVTSIGDGAFSACSRLTDISVPNSVTSIGDGAFSNCSSLTSMTIPNSITSISVGMFDNCRNLTSVTIPVSITDIGEGAFASCGSLINVTIPGSVKRIGDYAFYCCTSLTSMTIPDSVMNIGDNVFYNCSGLASVSLQSSVTSIGEGMFAHCSGLKSVTIPDSVTSIGDNAFYFCSSLTNVTIPDNVSSIGEYAFYHCDSLASITIPDSVTSIKKNSFGNCRSLTSVMLPGSVTSIEAHAFDQYEDRTYSPLPNLVFTVTPGSYAETWCMGNGLQYVATDVVYGDTSDWLNAPFVPVAYQTVGSYVTFGRYEQDNDETNGPEPIEWLVLDYDAKNNRALLLSRYGLDAKAYHTSDTSITWERCTLRTWLNKDFLGAAFTTIEQSAILTTAVDNSKVQGYGMWGVDGGNKTQDKIFLLSYWEAYQYLDLTSYDNMKTRVAPTAYAIKQGASVNSRYKTAEDMAAGWWWLRSPGTYLRHAANVYTYGAIYHSSVNTGSGSVRPALWLDLDADIF